MRARDDLRSRDPTSPALQQMNYKITKTMNEHRRQTWRQFVEMLDYKSGPNKLWGIKKAIDGKSPLMAQNEAITFEDSPHWRTTSLKVVTFAIPFLLS